MKLKFKAFASTFSSKSIPNVISLALSPYAVIYRVEAVVGEGWPTMVWNEASVRLNFIAASGFLRVECQTASACIATIGMKNDT